MRHPRGFPGYSSWENFHPPTIMAEPSFCDGYWTNIQWIAWR
jgi:hypothetical protein